MTRAAALAVTAVLVFAAPALAKKSVGSQESELGQAMALFVNGDFRGALGHFNAALVEAHGGAETARIQLLRGQCFFAISDEPDARHAFEVALTEDPEAQLDPNQVPPETIELLTKVRASLHAELTLLGQGGDALLDGRSLGPLPIHQSLTIGRHELQVLTADHKFDQHESILARPGDSVALRFDLPASAVAANPTALATTPTATAAPHSSTPSETPTPAAKVEPAAETSTEPASTLGLPVDLFGQAGIIGDPLNRAAAFEVGAGVGSGPLFGTVTGMIGESGGITVRAGGRAENLLGPMGAFACAELPIFFTTHVPGGLGIQGGLSARLWIFEPYVDLGGQHFFAVPAGNYPANYFLVGGGVRVHLP